MDNNGIVIRLSLHLTSSGRVTTSETPASFLAWHVYVAASLRVTGFKWISSLKLIYTNIC